MSASPADSGSLTSGSRKCNVFSRTKILHPAVLAAELVHHEQPHIIELHNYSSAHSMAQKL